MTVLALTFNFYFRGVLASITGFKNTIYTNGMALSVKHT